MMYKDKVEMIKALGSHRGQRCWCGANSPGGYWHEKIFHPYNCGSEECEQLEKQFNSLPDGDEEELEKVFG